MRTYRFDGVTIRSIGPLAKWQVRELVANKKSGDVATRLIRERNRKRDAIDNAAFKLRTEALAFARTVAGPVKDATDSTCIVANRRLQRAARRYAAVVELREA